MDQDIPESVVMPAEAIKKDGQIAEPLVPYRGAMKFEQLRLQTDRSNKHPKVFMLKVGHPATRTARSQFAANFFGCAGYEILDNLGFDSLKEGVEEARRQQADIVVLCSSDEEYRTVAPEAFQALKDEAIVVLAGYPKDQIEELKAVGIEHFIHLKSNLYDTLKGFQKLLGIEQA
jgi:methylmalonyl-CoA mutase